MRSTSTTKRFVEAQHSIKAETREEVSIASLSARERTMNRCHPRPFGTTCLQYWIATLLVVSFLVAAISLHIQQLLGLPLYWLNRRWYHAWQAVVKESTALLLLGLNQMRAPATARISGDETVRDQIRGGESPFCTFPDRIILIANHNLYTDWIFFWWTAYLAGKHGHLYIILKDSLEKIPIIGAGMRIFSWIFLSRRWESDQQRFQDGIGHLSDATARSKMWLLIFPEGTNMSITARGTSQKWAKKVGVDDFEHVLIPRSRGLQYCLQGLADTIDWMYDCTIAYEQIPKGEYGQEIHSLKALYVEGRAAPPAHMYWRRYAVKDIPSGDAEAFDKWLNQRWAEKDKLIEHFQQKGCFPGADNDTPTEIKIQHPLETAQILGGAASCIASWTVFRLLYRSAMTFWGVRR